MIQGHVLLSRDTRKRSLYVHSTLLFWHPTCTDNNIVLSFQIQILKDLIKCKNGVFQSLKSESVYALSINMVLNIVCQTLKLKGGRYVYKIVIQNYFS